jgi:hypothetical protein
MEPERYAPPTARVADVPAHDASPPLWNPDAAASWSLLFTPIFGAWLHMKNWEALGEARKARAAKAWASLSLVILVPMSLIQVWTPWLRYAAVALLLSWYVVSARGQARWVAERYGKTYVRKGWTRPLLLAVIAMILLSMHFRLNV